MKKGGSSIQFNDDNAMQRVREDRLLINRVDDWIYEEVAPFIGSRVLEIGCGLGNLARSLHNRDFYMGMDISAESVMSLQNLYGVSDNLRFEVLDITQDEILELKSLHLDTVVSLNVFEHISDDTRAFHHVHTLLEPGGRLVLIVPAHNWLYGTIDHAIGHYRRYTKHELSSRLTNMDFIIKKQKYINLMGALGWWFNGRVLKKTTPPGNQLKMMNKIIPPIKFVEQRIEPPFGVSVLTVAEKVDPNRS